MTPGAAPRHVLLALVLGLLGCEEAVCTIRVRAAGRTTLLQAAKIGGKIGIANQTMDISEESPVLPGILSLLTQDPSNPFAVFHSPRPLHYGGLYTVSLTAAAPTDCIVARGQGETTLERVGACETEVELQPVAPPDCSANDPHEIAIERAGAHPFDVRAEVNGKAHPLDGDRLVVPLGTPIVLRAVPPQDMPPTYFAGWEGAACIDREEDPLACELDWARVIGMETRLVASFAPRVCISGSCWHNPLPQGNTINGAWAAERQAAAAASIWLVGEKGTILHSDGLAFRAHAYPATDHTERWPDLHGVWGAGATEVWAVGEAGAVLFFDGNGWRRQVSGTSATLRAVTGDGAQAVAVGDGGTILRWAGGGWAEESSGTMEDLLSVAPLLEEGFVAVGAAGTILVDAGRGWQREPGAAETLRAVAAAPDGTVMAAGGRTLLRREGTGWTPVAVRDLPADYPDWRAIVVQTRDEVWLARADGVVHLLGEQARVEDLAGRGGALRALAWDGGTIYAAGEAGRTLRRRAGTWHSLSQGRIDDLYTLSGVAAMGGGEDDLWAAGDGSALLRLQDGRFRPAVTTDRSWRRLLIEPGGVLLAGSSLAIGDLDLAADPLRVRILLQDRQTRLKLWGLSQDSGGTWAVGEDSKVLWRGAGQDWTDRSPPTELTRGLIQIRAVFGQDGVAWIGGGGGRILQWDAEKWIDVTPQRPQPMDPSWRLPNLFLDLWGRGPDDLWVVGATRAVGHRREGKWEYPHQKIHAALSTGPYDPKGFYKELDINAVRGAPAAGGPLWLAADHGLLFRWDGSALRQIGTPAASPLRSLHLDSRGALWVAGYRGVVLRVDSP